jgi:predicted nucleic acid-binding protein
VGALDLKEGDQIEIRIANTREFAVRRDPARQRAVDRYDGYAVLCRLGLYSTAQKPMPAKDFLDTNVLIYAVAKNDARASQAEALLASGGVVSIQSLHEFVSVARRKLSMSWKEVNEFLDLICILCPNPVPISLDTHRGALAIAEKYGYSIYDALLVSAALNAGCRTLYSEDLQDGQVINRQLTIRDPFR